MSAALIVFAKPPVPGRVKTRLTPPLSPEDAARLYGAFLQDALDQYQGLGVTLRLYLALDEPPPGMGIAIQRGDTFPPMDRERVSPKGGGPWGAYEAGFRRNVRRRAPPCYPDRDRSSHFTFRMDIKEGFALP